MSQKPSVIFMGTPEFAATILKKLYDSDFPILAVFAQPDKPVGRGQNMASPPVAGYAKLNSLPLLQPAKIREPQVLETLQKLKPDFLIVAAYGKILPEEILRTPKIDCINVHASLLPKYRGAAPIQRAILDGQTQTGVSIMSMVYELDAGPVYSAEVVAITLQDTDVTLTHKLADSGAVVLTNALPKIAAGELQAKPQNATEVTYAHKLTKDMAKVDWKKSAIAISNQIRGLSAWPVAESTIGGKRLRLHAAQVLTSQTKESPGTIIHMAAQGLTVATGLGDLLLLTCQAEGKKRLPAFEVANGLRLQVGDKFV